MYQCICTRLIIVAHEPTVTLRLLWPYISQLFVQTDSEIACALNARKYAPASDTRTAAAAAVGTRSARFVLRDCGPLGTVGAGAAALGNAGAVLGATDAALGADKPRGYGSLGQQSTWDQNCEKKNNIKQKV